MDELLKVVTDDHNLRVDGGDTEEPVTPDDPIVAPDNPDVDEPVKQEKKLYKAYR